MNAILAWVQAAMQEAQEEAVQAAFSVFNSEAVGNGPVRRNYEKQLHATLKRQFEVLNDLHSYCDVQGVFSSFKRIVHTAVVA